MFIKPSSQTIQLQQFNSTNVQSRSGRAQPTLFCKAIHHRALCSSNLNKKSCILLG